MDTFHGRDEELENFLQLIHSQRANLATCQGRRRIGKSTFIRQCGSQTDHHYSLSGLAPQADLGKRDQLENFAAALAHNFNIPELPLESWPKAFHLLSTLLPKTGSCLLLLDEISWMSIGDPNFAGHLKKAWDTHFSQRPKLVLVLCGSVSSWIEENILNSTGFVGRISWQFRLDPLPLHHCNKFWTAREKNKAKPTPTRDKLRLLSITGGVPRYLEEIDPRKSAEQNIERLCFNKGGFLFNEFDQIFHDIFTRKASTYREIVRTLENTTIKNLGPYFQTKTQRRESCQIDLLIRTSAALYVVEAKAREKIKTTVIDEVRQKIERLKIPRSLPVRTALVHEGELEPGIQKSDFFDHPISFKQLLTFRETRKKKVVVTSGRNKPERES